MIKIVKKVFFKSIFTWKNDDDDDEVKRGEMTMTKYQKMVGMQLFFFVSARVSCTSF